MELLIKMYEFYKKRYSDNSEFEDKFNNAVKDLISTGDVTNKEYVEFCVTHDIEPQIKKKRSDDGPRMPAYDPCSGGGRNYRGGC
jgi:hypothetical protein